MDKQKDSRPITGYYLILATDTSGKPVFMRVPNKHKAVFASGDDAVPALMTARRSGYTEARLQPAHRHPANLTSMVDGIIREEDK